MWRFFMQCRRYLFTALFLGLAIVSVNATQFFCTRAPDCAEGSWCDGDYYSRAGCFIQCYTKVQGVTGEIIKAGSADCSTTARGVILE